MIRAAKIVEATQSAEPIEAQPAPQRPRRDPGERPIKPQRRRWPMYSVGLIAIATLAAGAVYVSGIAPRQQVQSPVVMEVRPAAVVGLGYVEPSTGVVEIGAPGNPDATRIAEVRVSEGDLVQPGQVLAVLDNAAKIEAQIKSSEAQIKLKQLMLDRQRLETRNGLAASGAALDRARADLESATAELQRQERLFSRGIVTKSTIEKRRRDVAAAEATVREMMAAQERRQAKVDPHSISSDTIDVAISEQELAVAMADLDVQRANLEQASVRAPFAGRVLIIKVEPGERIGSGGLLELGDTRSMRAVVEVYQTDARRIGIGQSVEISAEALVNPIIGTVTRIGAAIKRQSVINNDPASTTDARVIEVIVSLDEGASRVVDSLSRLQVEARFLP